MVKTGYTYKSCQLQLHIKQGVIVLLNIHRGLLMITEHSKHFLFINTDVYDYDYVWLKVR